MLSTMQDAPLTITTIMRHATGQNYRRTVTTALGGGQYRTMTYGEVGRQSGRLANALRGLGITGDQRVATFMWNNAEHTVAYLAIPSMGAVLHTLNIRLSPEQIAYIANEAEDQIVIADLSLTAQLAPVLPQMKTVHTVIAIGAGDLGPLETAGKTVLRYDELLAAQSEDFDWPEIDERSAAAMCYTSGTTGNPKGVVYSHRSSFLHAMATCTSNALDVGSDDVALPIVPMFHANAWGLPYAALMAGADLVMPDRFLDGTSLINLIETCHPTIACAVPTIWNDVMNCLEKNPGHDISSLRIVGCGGSAVPQSMMRIFQERYGVHIRQAWGMTETSPLATTAKPLPNVSEDEYWKSRATAGRPMCGVEIRIVDDAGAPLPHDGEAVGEIEIRGPWITGSYYLGYDASKFDSGWLRTGDVGRIDDCGFVTLTDRAKDVIKSGGEWISSVILENEALGCPGVAEAAAIGLPHPKWDERPLLIVVPKPGAALCETQVRDHLSTRVAKWWLPDKVIFADSLPHTATGKLLKTALRTQYADVELSS